MLWQLRLPAPQAAMINASMAHALDFDDTLDHGGSIHPGASVLAASLAVSDMLGGVSGQTPAFGDRTRPRCVLPRGARLDARSRLASHRGDGRVRRRSGCRQAAWLERGADGECAWDRIQPGRREPAVHRGWCADQASAGGPGCQQRRAWPRCWPTRASRVPTISSWAALVFSSYISLTVMIQRNCSKTWVENSAAIS